MGVNIVHEWFATGDWAFSKGFITLKACHLISSVNLILGQTLELLPSAQCFGLINESSNFFFHFMNTNYLVKVPQNLTISKCLAVLI